MQFCTIDHMKYVKFFFFFFEDVKGLFKLTGCTWVQDANFLSTVLRINICLFFNFHIIGLALSLCS